MSYVGHWPNVYPNRKVFPSTKASVSPITSKRQFFGSEKFFCPNISFSWQHQSMCISQATFLFISHDKCVSNCSLLGLQSLSLFLLSCLAPPSQALPARHGTWSLALSNLGAFVLSVELSARSCEDSWDQDQVTKIYQTSIIEATKSAYSALLCPQEDEVPLKQGGLDDGLSGNLLWKQWKHWAPLKLSLPTTMVLMRSSDFTITEILLGQSWDFTREAPEADWQQFS